MTNLFKSAAQNLVKSPFVIVITLVFFLLFIISLGLAYESYQTTLRGYQLMPTAKVNSWIIPLVALLPQVGEVAFTYIFAVDTRKRWGILIAFLLHIFDTVTDVFYKAHGQDWIVWILAFIESEVLFTLGAVVGLTLSLGMLIELTPHAIEQLGHLFHGLSKAVGIHDEEEDMRQMRRGIAGRDLE